MYLDQNAWVTLSRGVWDKTRFPREHNALRIVVEAVKRHAIKIPLSFTNVYETAKINDPPRRVNMAQTQALISGGLVFRSRRHLLRETLSAYLANRFAVPRTAPPDGWFLSDLWFESAADYSPETFGFEISDRVLAFMRANPAETLLDFLISSDDDVRVEAVRRYSASTGGLIARIEARRALAAGESLALRKRAYAANQTIDELDFIFDVARELGFTWTTVADLGSSLVRNMASEVAILNTERELAVRLEDQTRPIGENDLRDMAAFSTILPFADVVVGEKPFVNLARQARLGDRYGVTLLTSIFDFSEPLL